MTEMEGARSPLLPLLVVTALLLPQAASGGQEAAAVFATPEAVIALYLAGVAGNDVGRILRACAVQEMAAGFRFDLQVEALGGMMMLTEFLSPAESPFYAELNEAKVSARILNQVNLLTMGLLSGEEIGPAPIFSVDPQRVARFLAELDPARLADLELVRIALPDEATMADPRYLETVRRSAAIHGAAEQTERVALLSFEGRLHLIGFTLLRYQEDWKIASQFSPLADTDPAGTARETTLEEFEALLAGEGP